MQKLLSGQTAENHFVLCSFPQPRVREHGGRGVERLLKQEDGWECHEMLSLGHSTDTAFMGCISEHLYKSKPTSANVPTGIATSWGLPTNEGESMNMEVACWRILGAAGGGIENAYE